MNQHLPVLLVVVPLVAAPIAALLNRPRLSWAVAVAATLWALYASSCFHKLWLPEQFTMN